MPDPWTPEKRSSIKHKIDKQAAYAAQKLGAKTVAIIAFFPDGEYLHMLDGGTAPMPLKDLYAKLQTVHEVVEQSGGSDVAMN
jgi:hypothetical protein